MGMISQSLDDFKSAKSFEPTEPKKVQEYKEKAKKALQRKHYNKAYKYLHKAKTYREQPLMIVDEFWMMNREKMGDNANKFLKKMENEFTIFKDEMAFIDDPKYLLNDEFINNMGELLIKQRKAPIKVGMTIQNFED